MFPFAPISSKSRRSSHLIYPFTYHFTPTCNRQGLPGSTQAIAIREAGRLTAYILYLFPTTISQIHSQLCTRKHCSFPFLFAPISSKSHRYSPPTMFYTSLTVLGPNSSKQTWESYNWPSREASSPGKEIEVFIISLVPTNPMPQSHAQLCSRLHAVVTPHSLPSFSRD